MARRELKPYLADGNKVPIKSWQEEKAALEQEYTAERQQLHANDREQQRMVKMRDAELKRAQKRQKKLDRLFSKLYEDWAAERITEYNFKVLSEKYQTEQTEVLEKIERLQAELATEQRKSKRTASTKS